MILANPLQLPLPQHANEHLHWGQLYGAAPGLAIVNAAKLNATPIVVVTADMVAANRLYYEIGFFKTESLEVLVFPDWETLPYDTFSPHEDIISTRLAALSRLPDLTQGILIVPIATLMHPLMPREYLQKNKFITGTRAEI